MPLLIALAAILAGALFLMKRANAASVTEESNVIPFPFKRADAFDEIFVRVGNETNVDPQLLKAIATVESGLRPTAVRNNPPDDVSVGLMQILCIPDANGVCTNRFNVDGWSGMTFDALKDPETNIRIGAEILAWNIRNYGYPRGLAMYNAWSARHSSVNGPFPNDDYVQKVFAVLTKGNTNAA